MPPFLLDLYDRLSAHPLVRRAAWLGFLSLIAAITLTGYLFGLTDGFVGRALSATLVFWLLLGLTVMGIVPLLIWGANRLGGPVASPRSTKAGSRASASPSARANTRRVPTGSAGKWR